MSGLRSADGWTECGRGHTHWGQVGAAGLLIVHTDGEGTVRHLLQHRSAEVQHGLTWGIPGGALAHGETPVEGAEREAVEELGPIPDDLEHLRTFTDDHGRWAYHSVIVRAAEMFEPDTSGWEVGGEGYAWLTDDEVRHKQLHPGFAATWPDLESAVIRPSSSTGMP